jgi:hypothetical protein
MGNKNSNLAIVTPKNKNSNLNITTSNVSLERLVELYLNWNYNSDIINIICDYINLQPIKVKYHRVSQDIIGYDGPRKAPGAFHMCNDCHQICNDEKKHDLECIVRRNCLNCQYQGKSNTEYLEHKQNNCPMSLMKCQYCGIKNTGWIWIIIIVVAKNFFNVTNVNCLILKIIKIYINYFVKIKLKIL